MLVASKGKSYIGEVNGVIDATKSTQNQNFMRIPLSWVALVRKFRAARVNLLEKKKNAFELFHYFRLASKIRGSIPMIDILSDFSGKKINGQLGLNLNQNSEFKPSILFNLKDEMFTQITFLVSYAVLQKIFDATRATL